MSPSVNDLLRHILDEIDYLLDQRGRREKADLSQTGRCSGPSLAALKSLVRRQSSFLRTSGEITPRFHGK